MKAEWKKLKRGDIGQALSYILSTASKLSETELRKSLGKECEIKAIVLGGSPCGCHDIGQRKLQIKIRSVRPKAAGKKRK